MRVIQSGNRADSGAVQRVGRYSRDGIDRWLIHRVYGDRADSTRFILDGLDFRNARWQIRVLMLWRVLVLTLLISQFSYLCLA